MEYQILKGFIPSVKGKKESVKHILVEQKLEYIWITQNNRIGNNKMNICILQGKIISKIEYKFIINSKNKAIACFEMELLDKTIIRVKAYNDLADKCYRELSTGNEISIVGKLETIEEINLQEIYIIN